MRKTVVAIVWCLLAVSCADDPTHDAIVAAALENPPTTQSPLAEMMEESLELAEIFGFEVEEQSLTASQAELAELIPSATIIPTPHRLLFVDALDPNGDGTVGESWYTPRLLGTSCRISLDAAPVPTVGGQFVPGDPDEPRAPRMEASMELMLSGSSVAMTIYVLDSADQRDALLRGQLEFVGAVSNGPCGFVSLEETFGVDESFDVLTDLGSGSFPGLETFTPTAVGHPGWGFVLEGGFSGTGERRFYAVGDRLLVDLSAGRSMIQVAGEGGVDLSRAEIDTIAELLIAHLESAGYG